MNKKENEGDFKILVTIIAILILIILVIAMREEIRESRTNGMKTNESIESYKEVMNIILEENTMVRKNFKYVHDKCRNANNAERLFKEGGNCCSWTNYYYEIFKEKGLNVRKILYWAEPLKSGHQFLLVYWKGGYCIIDQDEIVGCNRISTE